MRLLNDVRLIGSEILARTLSARLSAQAQGRAQGQQVMKSAILENSSLLYFMEVRLEAIVDRKLEK